MNLSIRAMIATLTLTACSHAGITLTPGTLLIKQRGSRDIFQLDPITGATVGQLTVPGNPFHVAGMFTVIGGELFVTDRVSNATVAFRVDPSTGQPYGQTFNVPLGGGLARHGDLLEVGGGLTSVGLYRPSDWSQVRGRVDMDYLALSSPYNQAAYWGGSWNGNGYTLLFDQQQQPGTTSLISFGPQGQALANPVIATFQRPENTVATSFDVDEFSGDMWLHFRNNNAVGQTNYIAKFNPASPGSLNLIAVPFDIDAISVIPIPTPGAAVLVPVAGLVAMRRRKR